MTHFLIAPNSFKHALGARAVAEALARGIHSACPGCICDLFPIGDGGDGTGQLIVEACGGEWVEAQALDPLGRMISTSYGFIDGGKTAVIDMAYASGIRLLKDDERDPLKASSFGTGQLMTDALNRGVTKIILGMGGSATVDGGTGILRALGLRMYDDAGGEIIFPADLLRLHQIDTSGLDPRLRDCEVVVLCDVQNLLLGPAGASVVFGPQKGATAEMVGILENGLARLSAMALDLTAFDMRTVPSGGTAGGAASGLYSFIHARLVSGIDYFLDLTGFDDALVGADLVITGEGSLDEQTLHGKGPFGVAKRAHANHVPVTGVAGRISNEELLKPWFGRLVCINEEQSELSHMLAMTEKNLEKTGYHIGSAAH